MSRTIVVTGTDTGIGKTIFAAGLTQALNACYWKPVQAGLQDETDSQVVARLSQQPVLPEAYRLQMPASPHLAAEAEGQQIDLQQLALPKTNGPLVVEGAGGLMVPLNRQAVFLDLFVQWRAPVILCARTSLGTINHTLLSLKALAVAGCTVSGVVFIGGAEPAVQDSILEFSGAADLGRLPMIPHLSPQSLKEAFAAHIDVETIGQRMTP